MLKIHQLDLWFGPQHVLSLQPQQFQQQDWVAILGASGSGKTSFLRSLLGLATANARLISNITWNDLPLSVHDIAYMAQQDCLLPWLTVLENILLPIKLRGLKPDYAHAKQLLSAVQLSHYAAAFPHQLSGGMRQRIALARTLIENKPILLLDEPFTALDALTRLALQNLLIELTADKLVIFVTHDPNEAIRIATKIYCLQGQPSQLQQLLQLDTPLPRQHTDPTTMRYQAELWQYMLRA